jgi:hypothetical protein
MQRMQDVDMLLKPITVLLVIGLVIPGDTGAQQASTSPRTVLVRKNTALKFSLLEPLDPVPAKVGDDVPMQLARPLVVEGITLLPAGDVFLARVVKVKPPKKCIGGEVELELSRVTFSDSSTARTKVFFLSPLEDTQVDEIYSSHFSASNIPGALVISLVMLPLDLLAYAFGHEYCSDQTVITRPYKTVAVIFTRNHRVRY